MDSFAARGGRPYGDQSNQRLADVQNLYWKIGVNRRTHAALWGLEHGFKKDHRRIDDWNAAQGEPGTS